MWLPNWYILFVPYMTILALLPHTFKWSPVVSCPCLTISHSHITSMAWNVVSTEYVHRFLVMLLICDTKLLWADFPEFHWNYPTHVLDDSLSQVWRYTKVLLTNKRTTTEGTSQQIYVKMIHVSARMSLFW